MATDGKGHARPARCDYLDTAHRYASEAARCLRWVRRMADEAGEDDLAFQAGELEQRTMALAHRVGVAYHREMTDGE